MEFKKLGLLLAITFLFSACKEEAGVDTLNSSEPDLIAIEQPATDEGVGSLAVIIDQEVIIDEESSDEILSDEETNTPPEDVVESIDQPPVIVDDEEPPAEEEPPVIVEEEEPPAEEEPPVIVEEEEPPAQEEPPVIADEEVIIDEEEDEKCRVKGNLIANGSFEENGNKTGLRGIALNSIKSKKWDVFSSLPSAIEGKDSWYTSDGIGIEIQGDNTVTKTPHGNRVVELDSHGGEKTNSTMTQDVLLCRGKHIIKFMYYPRTKTSGDNIIEVSVDGRVIKSVDMTNIKKDQWVRIRAPFRVKQKGTYKVSFAAKGKENSLGGLIDKISLHKKLRRAGVVTSLLSLGDKDNIPSPLIRREVATAIIRKSVNFASMKKNPKVLMVKDANHNGESPDDFILTESVLKEIFGEDKVTVKSGVVRAGEADGFDVVYLINPGYPMGSAITADTMRALKAKGNIGLVIHGDDMARGRNFNVSDLTGLKYKSNGTSACEIRIDNNRGNKYGVKLRKRFFRKLSEESRTMDYANDIDHTEILNKKIRILAMAKAPNGCSLKVPAIVGYKLKRQKVITD